MHVGLAKLSPTEDSIAERFVSGYEVKEIAVERTIATSTVSWHLAKVRRKLGVHSRSELREALAKRRLAKKGPPNGTENSG